MKTNKQTNKAPRFCLVSDNDGHDYIIPVEDELLFESWVEAMESDEETALDFEDCRMNRSGLTFTDPQGWK